MVNPRIFIIAGEASGDYLGACLMRAVKAQCPEAVFTGIGGPQMEAVGLNSLFPMSELSVMGIAEVLPKLFKILSRMAQTVREILKTQPDALVTIDSPDFCFRVVKRVKAKTKEIPCIHYVAPSVWAWRPGRAAKVAKFLDHLLTLLPFEPKYFEAHGLPCTFVGHPVVERAEQRGDAVRFRQKYRLRETQPVLTMLPGSRMSELTRLLEDFSRAVGIMLRRFPETVVAVPTLPHLRPYLEKFFTGRGINPLLIDADADKFDCFSASTVALAASGTVSLELAVTDTPHIIAYKLSPLTYWLAKRLVKTPYVNLVNILMNRQTVPELLQEKCDPDQISRELLRLMERREARTAQLSDFREALIRLGLGDIERPSQKAAAAVLSVIARGARR